MNYNDPNDAPKASSTRFYKCDECEHLHVMLLDEFDRFIATAVVSREMLVGMQCCIDDKLPPEHLHS